MVWSFREQNNAVWWGFSWEIASGRRNYQETQKNWGTDCLYWLHWVQQIFPGSRCSCPAVWGERPRALLPQRQERGFFFLIKNRPSCNLCCFFPLVSQSQFLDFHVNATALYSVKDITGTSEIIKNFTYGDGYIEVLLEILVINLPENRVCLNILASSRVSQPGCYWH